MVTLQIQSRRRQMTWFAAEGRCRAIVSRAVAASHPAEPAKGMISAGSRRSWQR